VAVAAALVTVSATDDADAAGFSCVASLVTVAVADSSGTLVAPGAVACSTVGSGLGGGRSAIIADPGRRRIKVEICRCLD